MMSVKSWLILLVIYIAYLIIGGFVFNLIECPEELESNKKTNMINDDVESAIDNMKTKLTEDDVEVLRKVMKHWDERHYNKNETECSKWNYENSLFFSFTVVTTIGYGHQFPVTKFGKNICVLYALIGVPLNAILIGALGSVFSNKLRQFKHKLWQGLGKFEGSDERPRVVVVMVESLAFVAFFTSIFLLIPAALFTVLENDGTQKWDYSNSVYYTFITLSTIGFGDYVPDRQQNQNIGSPVGKMTYLIIIIMWIIFGMGYIFAVVEVISGTLKSSSKPVKKVIRGLRNQMQVNDYWRKIIGEIIALKHGNIIGEDNGVLVGGGGGSEPCLGEYESTVNVAVRRAVSTGDIQDGMDDDMSGGILGPAPAAARTESLKVPQNANFLSVPGGHVKTRTTTPEIHGDEEKSFHQVDIETQEDLNEDTITSLRQFLSSAKIAHPVEAWVENNMPGYGEVDSLAPTRQVSRHSSFRQNNTKLNHKTVGGFGYPTEVTQVSRRRSLQPRIIRRNSVKSNLSRQSTRSTASNTTGGPIGALLEQTTLGEFLTAVENVRKKSTMDLLEVVVDSGSRRPSIVRKLSRRKNSKESLALPHQLATLFSSGKSDPNTSDIPLIQGTPSPTISEKVSHKQQEFKTDGNVFSQHI